MSKKASNESKYLSVTEVVKKVNHHRKYSRWPKIDSELNRLEIFEFYERVWDEYSQILDSGNGIDKLLSIKKLIDSEFKDAQNHLDNFPDDADEIFKSRLINSRNLLGHRKYVLQGLLTHFATHGKIETTPDFDPRIKYHSENYWDTAWSIYNKQQLKWKDVYDLIIDEENELGLENRFSSFESFESARKRHRREQRSSN